MAPRLLPLLASVSLLAAGCSTMSDAMDSINPFASRGPKMAKLEPVNPTISVSDIQGSIAVRRHQSGTYESSSRANAVDEVVVIR